MPETMPREHRSVPMAWTAAFCGTRWGTRHRPPSERRASNGQSGGGTGRGAIATRRSTSAEQILGRLAVLGADHQSHGWPARALRSRECGPWRTEWRRRAEARKTRRESIAHRFLRGETPVRRTVAPHGPGNGIHGMYMKNHAMRQHGVHGCLDGSAHAFAADYYRLARRGRPLARYAERVSARFTGMRISSRVASASHLPEALIQRTPSNLTDVLPVAAWTSKGSAPMRAETSSKESISEAAPTDNLGLHRGFLFHLIWRDYSSISYVSAVLVQSEFFARQMQRRFRTGAGKREN